ncbi:MAG: serine/threonine-protein kinase [Vicinamibacterales bacterium]
MSAGGDDRWARAKHLFLDIVDLSADEQRRRVEAEPDPDLRREVASLIASARPPTTFLETPAVPREGLFSMFLDPGVPTELVGPYRLLSLIGHGGMGTVYLGARADEAFERRVAIKVVKRGMDSADILARFRRERETLARLEHPNIARFLDGGTTDQGLPYFVMEYVDGVPIDTYCRRHGLSVEARLQLFRPVCAALHYAHQNLVLHRDLKPDNILVNDRGVPKLVDFGIAKLLRPEGDASVDSTATRAVGRIMTLRYASPEQLKGEPLSTASDVFSLGVLLYELLTERRPHVPDGAGEAALIRAICDADPEPPSTAFRRPPDARRSGAHGSPAGLTGGPDAASDATRATDAALARRIEGDLDMIVLMALRKEPARRYGSAEQLADDLRRALEGFPVTARPDTLWYRVGKFAERHRGGVAATTVAALLLMAAGAVAVWQARVAASERDGATRQAARAERVTGFLRATLASADPNDLGKDVTVSQALDRAALRLDQELAAEPDVQASIRQTLGETFLQLGAYEKAEAHLRQALDQRLSRHAAADDELMSLDASLGLTLQNKGDLAGAESHFANALDLARLLHGEESRAFAEMQNNLGSLRQSQGRYEEAERLHRTNLALRRRLAQGQDDGDVGITLNNLAVVLGTVGRHEEAVSLHRECVALMRRLRPVDHPDIAAALTALASELEEAHLTAEAAKAFEEALATRTRTLGAEHPLTAWTMNNYAYLLFDQGRYAEAIALVDRILALRGRTLADSHPMVGASLILQAEAWLKLRQPAKAEPLLRETLSLRRQSLPAEHWAIANTESWLGECLLDLGRTDEARPFIEGSHVRLKALLPADHPRVKEAAARVERLNGARSSGGLP